MNDVSKSACVPKEMNNETKWRSCCQRQLEMEKWLWSNVDEIDMLETKRWDDEVTQSERYPPSGRKNMQTETWQPCERKNQKRSVHACTLETSRWIKGSTTKRENTGSQLLTYKVKNEKIKYDSTIVHGPVQNKSMPVPMVVWEVLSNSC